MKKKEIKSTIKKHQKWLKDNSKGERANFSGANLSYVNFSSVNLHDANFNNSDISESNFRGANLQGANFSGANLSGVDLRDSDLRHVDLSNSELSYADLRETNLSGANLKKIKAWNTIGNTREIKTVQTEKYIINIINGKMVQIGCKQHSFDDWMNFGDKTIDQMDHSALEWWKTWKPILKILVDKSK